MHEAVPDPRSRSRSRGVESQKFFHFQHLSPPPLSMEAGKWLLILKMEEISKFNRAGFFYFFFCPSFLCHVTLNLEENWDVTFQSGSPEESAVSPIRGYFLLLLLLLLKGLKWRTATGTQYKHTSCRDESVISIKWWLKQLYCLSFGWNEANDDATTNKRMTYDMITTYGIVTRDIRMTYVSYDGRCQGVLGACNRHRERGFAERWTTRHWHIQRPRGSSIGVGDGAGTLAPPPIKNTGKYFSGKNRVKFGNFVNFSCIFGQKCRKNVLPTQSWLSSYAYVLESPSEDLVDYSTSAARWSGSAR